MFKKSQEDRVELLKAKATNAVNVFTATVNKLKQVNEELEEVAKENYQLAEQHQTIAEDAGQQITKNFEVIGKIESILS